MKRWDAKNMLEIGKKLFAKIHRQKKHANHNNDVHFMARAIDDWLPQGVQAMINGTYDIRFQDDLIAFCKSKRQLSRLMNVLQERSLCYVVQNTSVIWEYQELLQRFIDVCWHETMCNYAIGLKQLYLIILHTGLRAEIVSA